jgi:pimeloyl-ACP methyl ester carboxylesterase
LGDNARVLPRLVPHLLTLGSLVLAPAVLGCAAETPPPVSPPPPPTLHSPFTGFSSAHYADPKAWLCLPGRSDACAADLDATELRRDGTRVEVRDTPAPGADQVDCFYVYPTVDLHMGPANHTDFSDLEPIARTTVSQAARFRTTCRLYVPLYRQTTFGTYLRGDEARRPYREVAVSDVVDAFLHYMGQYNQGHKVVLIGHSQGGEMVVELLKRFFDHDPVMRERLLLAMPIGWPMDVAPGQTKGGTFENLPACSHAGETGCIVGYRSYAAGEAARVGTAVPSPGKESLCVNPAELAHGKPSFSRTFFHKPPPPLSLVGVEDMATPFVMLRDFWVGQCVDAGNGLRYMTVAQTPGDPRTSPVNLGLPFLHGILGYHLFDMQFPQGDLVDLVAERARALGGAPPAPPATAPQASGSAHTATP